LHWRWSTPPLIALHNIDDRHRIAEWHTDLAANFSRLADVPRPADVLPAVTAG
jgi:hypothetical protein